MVGYLHIYNKHSILLSGGNNLNTFHKTKQIKQYHLGLKLGWTYLTLLCLGVGGLPYPALIHMKINLLQRFWIKVCLWINTPIHKMVIGRIASVLVLYILYCFIIILIDLINMNKETMNIFIVYSNRKLSIIWIHLKLGMIKSH